MSKKLGAWGLTAAIALVSSLAAADIPPGGGGAGGEGGSGGGGGGGGSGKKDGGCAAASPGVASGSAALAVGLGLLLFVPTARRRSGRRAPKAT